MKILAFASFSACNSGYPPGKKTKSDFFGASFFNGEKKEISTPILRHSFKICGYVKEKAASLAIEIDCDGGRKNKFVSCFALCIGFINFNILFNIN